LNRINALQVPDKVDKAIKNYINSFEGSKDLKNMVYGEDYYRSRNTEIMKRKMMIYSENDEGCPIEMVDPYKANNKLASGFLKLLVDQKINYSLGKDLILESEQAEELWSTLGDKFQTTLRQIAKESAKKATGWGHVYIDEEGKFKLVKIPSEQIIPVYSTTDDEQLELIIRYYNVVGQDRKGDATNIIRVEVWDNEQITYYEQDTQTGMFQLLNKQDMVRLFNRPYENPRLHLMKDVKYGGSVSRSEGLAWGRIPFIPLYNNDELETDLNAVKNYIDVYDIVESDFANNLEDFQDIYWILKGYQGENVGQFLEQVKRYKALKVSEEGDAKAEKLEVPYEARMTELKNLEEKIFTFGQGVNLNQSGDGNITNVVIRSRFANLDLKASEFEIEVEDFIFTLMYFVNKYRELTNQSEIILDRITFNRSMIINEIEMLEANTKQKGLVSEHTRLSNHTWIDDVEEELKMIEEEQASTIPLLDDIEEGEEDEPRQES
jgi:SPP1 family phage portal protein